MIHYYESKLEKRTFEYKITSHLTIFEELILDIEISLIKNSAKSGVNSITISNSREVILTKTICNELNVIANKIQLNGVNMTNIRLNSYDFVTVNYFVECLLNIHYNYNEEKTTDRFKLFKF